MFLYSWFYILYSSLLRVEGVKIPLGYLHTGGTTYGFIAVFKVDGIHGFIELNLLFIILKQIDLVAATA